MEQYVIGTDIGTGSAKAVAVATNGKPIASAQVYYKTKSPQAGFSEQEPEIIWKAFVQCINEIIAKLNRVPLCVSMSSAMHSLLVTDGDNNTITSLITWEDIRSEKIAAALRQSPEAKKIYDATGTPIHSMSPLCKIKWLKENETGIFKKAYKFISIKEFIWHRLFNIYEIDYSIASSTGLFNISKLEWNTDSLKYCGITTSQLSKPVATNFIRNNINESIAAELQIPANTTFCIGASDGCLANLGSNAIETGIAALTIGTSGAVRIAVTKPVVNFDAMFFNYVLDESTFICGGPVNNGGNVLKWLFKTFLNNTNPSAKDYSSLFQSINNVPAGCEGLIFLPYIYGERAPIWDEKASGAFVGIHSLHTNAYFLRAALEGICFSLKVILETIEKATTIIKQVHISGGFVHSKIWMQMLADISNKPLCLVQTEDASSTGAALLGMKSLEIINNYPGMFEKNNVIINPEKEQAGIYEKYYLIFKNLYQPLKASMAALAFVTAS